MKNRILWIPLLGILAIMNLIGCSSEEKLPPTVTLEANKTSIKANGRDSITFVVKVNGQETTQGVTVRSESGQAVSSTRHRHSHPDCGDAQGGSHIDPTGHGGSGALHRSG